MEEFKKRTLDLHKLKTGKLDILPNLVLDNNEILSMAYTPGVGLVAKEIHKDKSKAYEYTIKGKTVVIISDGSAVLGLGKIGPEAALPVMEGKAALLYQFARIQAMPICLDSFDEFDIIKTAKLISPNFCAIMLEDISAPKCVYIEDTLQKELPIPIFHDDQHGTAIVVGAALLNALKVVGKNLDSVKIVVLGTGAAGSAIIKILNKLGAREIYAYNISGVLSSQKYDDYDFVIQSLYDNSYLEDDPLATNLEMLLKDKDVLIGVSAANIVTKEMIEGMNDDAIVFALANPDPEIIPSKAREAKARIIGTGRSDFPNQINNVLVFPGLMKGALQAKAHSITDEMKLAALKALSNLVSVDQLSEEFILPSVYDERVVDAIAQAVINAVKKEF